MESRFVRIIQAKSNQNVALHFSASNPSTSAKSMGYFMRPGPNCRRWVKVVAVALANKMARTAWALMVHGGTYRAPELAEAA
jgi:hypothetical protein